MSMPHPEESENALPPGLVPLDPMRFEGSEAGGERSGASEASARSEATELLRACRDDFALFNEKVLGRPPCWSRQLEIAGSVARHRDTVVASGNGTGKTWLAAGLILWYLYTRPRSLVVVTGPSQISLGSVTFKEVRSAWFNARYTMGGKLTASLTASPQLLDVMPGQPWHAIGISTTSVERLSGRHSRNLFAVIDEASGVSDEIFEAIDSLNYERLLAIGNPLRPEGRFYELWRQAERERLDGGIAEARRVSAIRVASTESPDCALDRSPRGLADADWLDAMRRRYREGSNWWLTHVEARFPEKVGDALIPPEWLERLARPSDDNDTKPWTNARIACDLALGTGGDNTVIIVRDHSRLLHVEGGNEMGLEAAAKRIAALAKEYKVDPYYITYDAAGIGRDMPMLLEHAGVEGARGYSGSAAGGNGFTNLRTAAAFELRKRLHPLVEPPFIFPRRAWWPTLREELTTLRFESAGGGDRTKLESKEMHKFRLHRSPDYADALIQSFSY